MDRHLRKKSWSVLGFSVIVLEVAAYIVFVAGMAVSVYAMMSGTTPVIVILSGLGALVSAFVLMALGEFLQVLMRIEANTRKPGAASVAKRKAPVVRRRRTARRK